MGRLLALLSILALSHAVRVSEEDLEELHELEPNATESTALVAVQEEGLPVDYWSKEKVQDRCRQARRSLVIKKIFGFGGALASAGVLVVGTWISMITGVVSVLAATGSQGLSVALPWFVVFVVATPGTVWAGSKINKINSDTLSYLFGIGRSQPACCCPNSPKVGINKTSDCHLLGSRQESMAKCPADWTRSPSECATVEVDTYRGSTAEGCSCTNVYDCKSNPLFRGHAWCNTEKCGKRHFGAPWRRWDFCLHQEEEIVLEEGTGKVNEALAKFEPNVYRRGLGQVLPRANFMYKFGVWTDGGRGVATARRWVGRKECFAALPEETLNGCAQRCLREGAPNARMMTGNDVGDVETHHECVAFAFERSKHLCVTLPNFAKRAEFFKHLTRLSGGGWQNFILRDEL